MEEYYFLTGIILKDTENPFLLLLNDSADRYEIVVCRNSRYDQEKRLFGGTRDLCELFKSNVTPLLFVDKVAITKDDGHHFPVRVVSREDDGIEEKWTRKIGLNDLNGAVSTEYKPVKIMNFVAMKQSILNNDTLMLEDRYFSSYCNPRVVLDVKQKVGEAFLKRFRISSKNSTLVYEVLLPSKRENYHLRFEGEDPVKNPSGLAGTLLRFRMKIMKHVYGLSCPFATISLPESDFELGCYGDAKRVYTGNRYHQHNNGRQRHVILGPVKGRYLAYCRNTGEIKLRGVKRDKVVRFISKNFRKGQIVHYVGIKTEPTSFTTIKRSGNNGRGGGEKLVFFGIPITRIKPADYSVMRTALLNMATRRDSADFYKKGAVVYGKHNYTPQRGTTTFDYSNFYASCLKRTKVAPNLSNVCEWLSDRRAVRPECKKEIVRLLGNLKHSDEYGFNVMKTESVNVMLKTLKCNENESIVSVCTDSVTFDGLVENIVLPYPDLTIKTETKLKPGTCFYQNQSKYFGVNETTGKLILKGILGKGSSPPVIREFVEAVVLGELNYSKVKTPVRKFNTSSMLIVPAEKYCFSERPDNKTKFYPGEMAYQDSAHDTAVCFANMRDNKHNSKILTQNVNGHQNSVVHKFFSGDLVHVNSVFNLNLDKYELLLCSKLKAAFKLLLKAFPGRKHKLRNYYESLKLRAKRDFEVLAEQQKGVAITGAFFDPICTTLFSEPETV